MANTTRAVLAVASVHAADLAGALSEALAGSGHDTDTPAEVVDIIDDTLRQLHQIRERAIGESRRRLDAAMERSAALLDEFAPSPHRPTTSSSVSRRPVFTIHSASSVDEECNPVVVAGLVLDRAVGVLQQLVDEAAAVVLGDLRLLADVLAEPAGVYLVDAEVPLDDLADDVGLRPSAHQSPWRIRRSMKIAYR